MALIRLEEVAVGYEGVNVVEHVSFEIRRGEYLAILGRNGSGKTSLMKAMLGLVRVKAGRIRLGDGLTREGIGYLPQSQPAQRDFPASVEEVVQSGLLNQMGLFPRLRAEHRRRAEEMMAFLNIEGLRKKPYRTLSARTAPEGASGARAVCFGYAADARRARDRARSRSYGRILWVDSAAQPRTGHGDGNDFP